jgi:hypothetical protein
MMQTSGWSPGLRPGYRLAAVVSLGDSGTVYVNLFTAAYARLRTVPENARGIYDQTANFFVTSIRSQVRTVAVIGPVNLVLQAAFLSRVTRRRRHL